ncbi:11017_t:CDS:2 [Funneliformis mosseae]|uniref:11017_t:CDS:1 n=1 Tax=Funneliformis mosseae TaxID=27381 RepID=A0A9N9B762_FUNMO|nr:11017_t:CDS:2 [Funneliformis mosseae]
MSIMEEDKLHKTLLMIEIWDVLELKQATKPRNSKNNRIARTPHP